MKFLQHVAQHLYQRRMLGLSPDEQASLRVVFPSRRARIYFAQHLSAVAEKPLWLPAADSIGGLFERISGLREANRYAVVAELFGCYKQAFAERAKALYPNATNAFDETFEQFFYWGDLMLRDFDELDKYLVKADPLLKNLTNIRDLEDNELSFLSREQLMYLTNFWKNVKLEKDLPKKFCDFWDILKPTYDRLRAVLKAKGMGYAGMIYREAVEQMGDYDFGDEQYVFVGFSALTACEEKLFAELQKRGKAEFYWDYDCYYRDSEGQEAGRFVRKNFEKFRPADADDGSYDEVYGCFAQPKNISIVAVPTELMQAKTLPTLLKKLPNQNEICTPKTAVVLTNPNLLIPVLYSLGEAGNEAVNITMGYPLAQTSTYSLLEFVMRLQKRARGSATAPRFYHKDVLALLGHEYLHALLGSCAAKVCQKIVERNMVYLSPEQLAALLHECGAAGKRETLTTSLFAKHDDYKKFMALLKSLLEELAANYGSKADESANNAANENLDFALQHAAIAACVRSLNALGDSLAACGEVDISVSMACSFLLAALKGETIPFEGEPVSGLQVMGILETRLLDFDNIIVLSLNEDTFPSAGGVQSLLPYDLRRAYELPTIEESEALHAYYFYRLLQRAQNVALLYNSGGGEQSSGEMTRYLRQLLLESPHKGNIAESVVAFRFETSQQGKKTVEKVGEVRDKLAAFASGERKLSASSMKNFMSCPMMFYYASVQGLRENQEVDESPNALLLGNAFHGLMEELYGAFVGQIIEKQDIKKLLENEEHIALRATYYTAKMFTNLNSREEHEPDVFELNNVHENGELYLLNEVVKKYVEAMLRFDLEQAPFRLLGTEAEVEHSIEFCDALGNPATVQLCGIIDRVDEKDGAIKIIDYKTGSAGSKPTADSFDKLFSAKQSDQRQEIFQTMLYSLFVQKKGDYAGKKIAPMLYFLREFAKGDATCSGSIQIEKQEVSDAAPLLEEFEHRLQDLLQQIFDYSQPFTQAADEAHCQYCKFGEPCGK